MKFNWLAVLSLVALSASGCRTVHQRNDITHFQQKHGLVSAGEKATVSPVGSSVSSATKKPATIMPVAFLQNEETTKLRDSDTQAKDSQKEGKDSAEAKQRNSNDENDSLGNFGTIDRPALESELNQLSGGMTLADFEALALENNPTIQELAATTQKAAGYRTQVGLRPNPTVGYQANQLADQQTDQHTAFIEQEFVRGGKLQLNRRVLDETLRAQLFELDAQRFRVATDVRIKFYEALGAQRRMQLISDFRSVVEKGLSMSEQLVEAGEATRIDVIQSKIQKNEIELAGRQATVAFESAWRELAAISGTPELAPTQLAGVLPDQADSPFWNELANSMVASSPEFAAAQTRINRAKANLQRQGVQAIPNITAQLAAGFDNATDSGLINLQIGAPIPVFNKNQGNIAAARAEYCRAVRESERIENGIKARLAAVSKDFDSALAAIRQYADEILPAAQESLDLAEKSYQAGETSFVQVLVARKTYFDSNLQFVTAQAQLAQAQAKIDGNVLTGSLDPVRDDSGDDSLRGMTFGQQ